MYKYRWWLVWGVVAGAAASVMAAETPAYDLAKILADDERLYREWSQAEWDNSVYGEESDIAGLLEKYSYLSNDAGLLTFLREREAAAADPVEKRRLHYLYRDLATTYEANKTVIFEDEIQNHFAQDRIWVPGRPEPVPLRAVYPLIRRTDEEVPYTNLWYASDNYVINVINPLRRARLAVHDESTKAMGYASYADFYYRVLGYAPGQPATQAQRFRAETFPMYKEIITGRCRKLFKKDPAETPPWESKNLWFGKEYDPYFPKEKFLTFTYGTFAAMGLDIRAMPNVQVDDADRPEKEPRAACFDFSVPGDVRVNLKPVGGGDDSETAFHEFGHACHAAWTDAALPFELRQLGSNELTETYAMFFQGMFRDRTFLVEELGMPESVVDDYLLFGLANDLGSARSTAFDVIYDEALHDGTRTPDDAKALYERLIDEQRLFPKYAINIESEYLNVDEGFYALYYGAAFYAAAQLKAVVVAKFGPRWYKNPATGEFLQGLFRQGNGPTVDEMLRQIGYPEGVNPDYLVAEYKARYDEIKKKKGK